MSASDDERREELRGRLANVIRIAAGLSANHEAATRFTINEIAEFSLYTVLACERVCGIGETGGSDD